MLIYKNATYWIYHFDGDIGAPSSCEVHLSDSGEISVSYRDGGREVVFAGKADANENYVLTCTEFQGRASLQRFPASRILGGYWEVGDKKGMWRIGLGDAPDETVEEQIPDGDQGDGTLSDELARLLNAKDGEEELEDWGEPTPRIHVFPLRSDWAVRLRLPDDLSRGEGRRLARYVKSLATDR
jgi:hypothetical protein